MNDKKLKWSEVSTFLDLVFQKKNYPLSFPHVFSQDPRYFVHTETAGALESFTALYPVTWKLKDSKQFSGICIGSVSVHPEAQKKGLGSAIIAHAEKRAGEFSADFLYLFSDLDKFYEKCGYKRAGSEWFIHFSNAENVKSLNSVAEQLQSKGFHKSRSFSVKESSLLNECEAKEIFDFIGTHSSHAHSVLSQDAFLQLLKIPQMKILEVRKNNTLECVAALGKGIDFEDTIHCVFFSDSKSCLFMLSRLYEEAPKPYLFMGELLDEKIFQNFLLHKTPSLFLKVLNTSDEETIRRFFSQKKLYVRGIQSA